MDVAALVSALTGLLRHSPSLATARAILGPDEQFRAESGGGPAWVITQPRTLQAWMRSIMPGETGGASGVLGGLLGH